MIAEPTHLGVQEDRERAPEMEDGLGMDLRDPRFGHLEDLPDFLHGEFLVIVQRDHHFFLLGQGLDRLRQQGRALLGLDARLGTLGGIGGYQVEQGEGVAVRRAQA